MGSGDPHCIASVLVETSAIAGEAIIRLARARAEDPSRTWEWLMATEWTKATP
ncbi:hypothetical protein [Streptomyces sp. NPDC047974]|uniref:hypothetical protein n=1 Tax=Streptomyces sp. NPDC047974 TaxID=3154343 RepID=UPI003411887E